MRLPIAGLVAALILTGCGPAPGPDVDDAWIRLPAVSGRPGAAYFEIRAGQRPLTLLSVRTPAALRSELHESMAGHAGMTSMTPIDHVAVPAGGHLKFAPGGRHVMLFDVDPALKPGAATTVTLTFADGITIAAKAKVRGAAEAAP